MMTEAEKLAALDRAATQGVWEVDSEYDNEALYSGGGGCGRGFKNYFIGTDIGGKWKTLLDTVNSDEKLINDDYDGDGGSAWDTVGEANSAFIVALVNAYRANQLVLIGPDAVERVARALAQENGLFPTDDWRYYINRACAALAALGVK
jgi:hypothetical protein